MIKRGILLVLLILVSTSVSAFPSSQISASPSSNVDPGQEFSITVTGYNTGSYIDRIEIEREGSQIHSCDFTPNTCGTSSADLCTCTKTQLTETAGGSSVTYKGLAYTGVANQEDIINIQVGTNNPPSFTSINIPSSAAEDHPFDITITATDSTGLQLVKITRQSDGLNIGTEPCDFATSCTLTVTGHSESVSQTYLIEAFDKLDLSSSTTHPITINPNQPPTILTSSLQDATEGQPYTYTIQADDPEGDSFNFKMTSPAGMSIGSASGTITWTNPTAGTYNIQVIATDEYFAQSSKDLTLTVNTPSQCTVASDCGLSSNICLSYDCVGGSCVTVYDNGAVCDDGNQCTNPDVCSGGICAGSAINCNDNNPCTIDSCDAFLGCQYSDESQGTSCGAGMECDGAGTCISSCIPSAETCNSIDDDCDTLIDETFNIQSDVNNCGTCGNVCNLANTLTHTCSLGTCEVQTCNPNQWDINQIDLDGCEYSCTQFSGQESAETDCTDGFDNDCDNLIDSADPDCNVACTPPLATQSVSCGTGECANTATQTCVNGQWSGTCTPLPPSTEICTDTIDNDCDTFTDCSDSDCVNAAECQKCYGVTCPTNQYCNPATGACDCSNPCTDSQKQCSTSTSYEQCQTDSSLCAYWGVEVSCSVNEVCSNGVCVCGSGLTDCSGSCVDLQSGPSNCGSCGNSCYTDNVQASSCSAGTCMITGCSQNYWNINSYASDGCEYFCEYKGTEACDVSSIDENCNNQFNENCLCADGTTQACGLSKGECSQGTMACAGGAWS